MAHQSRRIERTRRLRGVGRGVRLSVQLGACLVLVALALLGVSGCGGGGEASSVAAETGDVRMTVVWPDQAGVSSAAMPAATQSIRVHAICKGTKVASVLIVRPQVTGTLANVPCGNVTLRAQAFATTNATGDVIAGARTTIAVRVGNNSVTGLSLVEGYDGGGDSDESEGPDGSKFIWVPAGEFMMGSEDDCDDAKPVHRVRITQGFWIAQCEVTNVQYARFLTAHGSNRDGAGHELIYLESSWCHIKVLGGIYIPKAGWEFHPVQCVTWHGAKAYCGHHGLCLPTEAEWEYVARGPQNRSYPWGNDWDPTKCCTSENRGSGGEAFPVGSFPKGASWCGAFDMAGNVWEWCEDWYAGDYYSSSPGSDPKGPQNGLYRVIRGGSWACNRCNSRSALRFWSDPVDRFGNLGFRPVSRAGR